jgi:ABC-type amino acid transport substrate-binding protein
MEPILPSAEGRVLDAPPALPPADRAPGERLELVRQRGSLRVGYFRDALAQAFRNTEGRLVGFDVEMAHQLARELGVRLDLVQIDRSEVAERLDDGSCDLVVSGLAITPELAGVVQYSRPVMDLTLAFVVPDERRNEFAHWYEGRSPSQRRRRWSVVHDLLGWVERPSSNTADGGARGARAP